VLKANFNVKPTESIGFGMDDFVIFLLSCLLLCLAINHLIDDCIFGSFYDFLF
jgi:hypothetical protein